MIRTSRMYVCMLPLFELVWIGSLYKGKQIIYIGHIIPIPPEKTSEKQRLATHWVW